MAACHSLAGAAVIAPSRGTVLWGGQTLRRGNGLIIDHSGGVVSGSYHMAERIQLRCGALAEERSAHPRI